jgi:hypothetical protein
MIPLSPRWQHEHEKNRLEKAGKLAEVIDARRLKNILCWRDKIKHAFSWRFDATGNNYRAHSPFFGATGQCCGKSRFLREHCQGVNCVFCLRRDLGNHRAMAAQIPGSILAVDQRFHRLMRGAEFFGV